MNTTTVDKKIYKAIVAFQTSKIQSANLIFKNLIKTHPKYAPVHYNAGVFYKNIGKFDEAKKYLKEAVKLNEHFYTAHRTLSNTTKYKKDATQTVRNTRGTAPQWSILLFADL